MEEPRKGIPKGELADRAEQDRLRKRFREEEEKINRDKLLFGAESFGPVKEKNTTGNF
ncbi:MAG TPA: hypothetical protein VIA07_09375 [Desulfuromonadales bacterium]|jgi:hypothetical protein